MNGSVPFVSVVIPTHNRRRLLERALHSVRAQSFTRYEVLVVDDASTDGTWEWLRAHWPGAAFRRCDAGVGAAAARNRGIERASGELIAFLDDDDCWRPAYLETQVAQMQANPRAEMSTTGHVEATAGGSTRVPELAPLSDGAAPLVRMLAECPIHTLSVVVCRKSAFARVGLFDERLKIVHDLDWYIRLMASGGEVVHNSAALVEHAVPGGLVTRHRLWFEEESTVLERFFHAAGATARAQEDYVRAARALLFARIALGKGDVPFGLARLAGAFRASPFTAAQIAARAAARRWRRRRERTTTQ